MMLPRQNTEDTLAIILEEVRYRFAIVGPDWHPSRCARLSHIPARILYLISARSALLCPTASEKVFQKVGIEFPCDKRGVGQNALVQGYRGLDSLNDEAI